MALVSAALGGQVFLIRHVLDDLLIRKDRTLLAFMPLSIIGLYGLQAAGELGRGYLSRRVGQEIIFVLRNQLYRKYQQLSIDYLWERPTGMMMTRVTHDVECVQRAVTAFITLIQKPLTLAVLIFAATWQEPRLTGVALVGVPLVIYPISRLSQRLRYFTRQALDSMGSLNSMLQESFVGARIIRAFSMEEYEARRFENECRHQHLRSLQAVKAMLLSGPTVQLVASFGAAAIVWLGGVAVMEGRSTPGSLLAFLVSLGLMNDPLKSLAQVPLLLSQTRVGIERIFEVLDAVSFVEDRPTAIELDVTACEIVFDAVSFGYTANTAPIVKQVNLHVKPGETLALVGRSGGGKSTLLNLMLRFYDVNMGSIRINGIDIRDLTVRSLRQHIGLVTQETFLFNDSIRNNIAYGQPERSLDEVRAAAILANADEFIRALPNGYDTPVGDLGVRLSGGQRQRIAIARALMKNAPILILDEATSALDQNAEEEVQRALETLMRNRTTLVVAHRLSTVRSADRIAVVDDGTIVEMGNHDELMSRSGTYYQLYARQAGNNDSSEVAACLPGS